MWLVGKGRITLWIALSSVVVLVLTGHVTGELAVDAIKSFVLVALGAEAGSNSQNGE
jgi:hypothetical protein